MRSIVDYILKTPLHSIFAAVLLAYLPLLSVLSAAIIVLVTLHKGIMSGFIVFLTATLPISAWLAFQYGDFTPLIIFSASFYLASVLHYFVSWEKVLLANIPTAILCILVLFYWQSPSITALIQTIMPNKTLDNNNYTIIQLLGMCLTSIYIVIPVIIGRWMQSFLYSGKKFQAEFHHIRLSATISIGLILVMITSLLFNAYIIIAPLLTIFIFTGLSLVHHWVTYKKLANYWLTLFYGLLFILTYVIFLVIVLGIFDSLFNIRKHFAN